MTMPAQADTVLDRLNRLHWSLRWHLRRMPERAVEAGLPPAWLNWRWMPQETLRDYVARHGADAAGRLEVVHPATRFANPLPRNVARREELTADPGWWGFSFADVPDRATDETVLARLPDCRILFAPDPTRQEFHPCIVNADGRALKLREITFKPWHADALRSQAAPARMRRATWILERVYDNHSHWLTAHLPKLCLLKARGQLDDVVLPARRTPVIDASFRLLGLDPADFPIFDAARPLEVEELTVLNTDRFRPDLLRPVRDAMAPRTGAADRRVFISRARSKGRRLVNEEELWPILRAAGFERVFMEEIGFEQQVELMAETGVLLAPHGAGLTNMLFCPEGAQVVEIADPAYPNPNFYALASAMGLGYWLVPGRNVGEGHLLWRDLAVDPAAVQSVLARLPT